MSKSRDIYFCLGFHEFLGSQENHRIITGKSIDIFELFVFHFYISTLPSIILIIIMRC